MKKPVFNNKIKTPTPVKEKKTFRETVTHFLVGLIENRTTAGKIVRALLYLTVLTHIALLFISSTTSYCLRWIFVYELMRYIVYGEIMVLAVIAIAKRMKTKFATILTSIICGFVILVLAIVSVIVPFDAYIQYMYKPVDEIKIAETGDKITILKSIDFNTQYTDLDDTPVEVNAVKWTAVPKLGGATVTGEIMVYESINPQISVEWISENEARAYLSEMDQPYDVCYGEIHVVFDDSNQNFDIAGREYVQDVSNAEKTRSISIFKEPSTITVTKGTLKELGLSSTVEDYGTCLTAYKNVWGIFLDWGNASKGVLTAPPLTEAAYTYLYNAENETVLLVPGNEFTSGEVSVYLGKEPLPAEPTQGESNNTNNQETTVNETQPED